MGNNVWSQLCSEWCWQCLPLSVFVGGRSPGSVGAAVMCCSQHLVPKREIPVTCNLSFYFPARSGTSLQCKSQLDKVTHLDLQEKKKKGNTLSICTPSVCSPVPKQHSWAKARSAAGAVALSRTVRSSVNFSALSCTPVFALCYYCYSFKQFMNFLYPL